MLPTRVAACRRSDRSPLESRLRPDTPPGACQKDAAMPARRPASRRDRGPPRRTPAHPVGAGAEARAAAEARKAAQAEADARHRASVTRQALVGAAILLAGAVWGIAVAKQVGDAALDQDPAPLLGPLIVIGIGAIVMAVAAYRKMFRRPVAYFRDASAKEVLERIAEMLD